MSQVENAIAPLGLMAAGVTILAAGWCDWVGIAAMGASLGLAIAHVSGAK
jgi:hypothetical protein